MIQRGTTGSWLDDEPDDDIPEAFKRAAQKVARELLDKGSAADRFAKYHDDPIAFFREELSVDPWESEDPQQQGQADIIRAVRDCDLVAVKSGHKISKSLTATGLSLWWVATRSNARVLLTAPTFHQVKNILWRELRMLDQKRGIAAKLGTVVPLDPGTGVQLPNGNEIVGISTKKQENMAGVSGANLLFIVDEASGYPDDLWEVLESGNSAGGAKILAISNPSRTAGWFFNLFRRKLKGWVLLTISSENTPNVRAKAKVIPGLATFEFIDRMREKIGPGYETDPVYMVRVLGEFPLQATDAVIHLELLNRGTKRWTQPSPHQPGELVLGVDVARFGGDQNVIWPVRDLYAYQPVEAGPGDGPTVAMRVLEVAADQRVGPERVRVNVDGIGVGASVVDSLKASQACQDGWLVVVELQAGESPDEDQEQHFPRLRDQLWFGAREWLKDGGALPAHEQLEQELLCATYTFDLRNKQKVLAKDVMREVLGRSPDHADAFCMAVYRGKRGRWYEYAYTAVPDHRRDTPERRVPLQKQGDPEDWGGDGGGTRGGGGFGCF